MNVNLSELGKIVREMESDAKSKSNYNRAAADIVKQGVMDKAQAKTMGLGAISGPKVITPRPLGGIL
jgi:hypothetical protein